MADLLLACTRLGHAPLAAERLRRAALRLVPPEVPPREPLLHEAAGVVAAVANPTTGGVWLRGGGKPAEPGSSGGICIGGLFGATGGWWRAGGEAPEGTYALVRWDVDTLEAVSDICASLTLWYVLSNEHFLVSTSQRALVSLLGSFELLPEATACFLSSGTLGPEVSWDARIRRVLPDARITLDRAAWRVSERHATFDITAAAGAVETHVSRLRNAIATTCGGLNIDLERWVLPLSGGQDSRTLLGLLVRNGLRPRCVTWTTRASLRNPLSDASIARVLARRYRVEHELFFLDSGDGDVETTLTRFVAADEGRNDEIAGYLDGFALWRDLTLAGVQGIIRGDESLGARWHPRTAESVRTACGGATPADYPEGHLVRRLVLADQDWPDRLSIGPHERLGDYSLRLDQHCYIPILLAGLNGAKGRYLAIVNPLLSRKVIHAVRSLPPRLRGHAEAIAKIVDRLDRSVPFARFSSMPAVSDFLATPQFLEIVVRELTGAAIERILPGDGPLHILAGLTQPSRGSADSPARLRALAKLTSVALPYRLAERLRPAWRGPEPLPAAQLAFRALLASRTVALFEEDAGADLGEASG